jgi:type VII secretion protein EccE
LGALHVTQLLVAEVAIISVLAVEIRSPSATSVAAVAAALVLGVTLGRWDGRWWIERRLLARRLRQRRSARRPSHQDARIAMLRTLAPRLAIDVNDGPEADEIAVARDDAGWFAAVAVTDGSSLVDEPSAAGLPLDALAATISDAEQPGAVVQAVIHTVSAPTIHIDEAQPASASYRELLQRYGAVPADRVIWVAVRLDARALAEAGARSYEDVEQAPAVVAALARRVAKALRRAGFAGRVLDRDALLDALARSCDIDAVAGAETPGWPRERWHTWHSGRMAHRSCWLQGWPGLDRAHRLLDSMAAAPTTMTSLALILAPGPDGVDVRCLLRAAAAPKAINKTCRALNRAARSLHSELFWLDGEQGPAVYATAPTGGGPR